MYTWVSGMIQINLNVLVYNFCVIYNNYSLIYKRSPRNPLLPLYSRAVLPHRRAAVRVFVAELQEEVCPERRVGAAHQDAHRREELRLPRLPEEVHALRPPQVW